MIFHSYVKLPEGSLIHRMIWRPAGLARSVQEGQEGSAEVTARRHGSGLSAIATKMTQM
jgi:hypothetical protein